MWGEIPIKKFEVRKLGQRKNDKKDEKPTDL